MPLFCALEQGVRSSCHKTFEQVMEHIQELCTVTPKFSSLWKRTDCTFGSCLQQASSAPVCAPAWTDHTHCDPARASIANPAWDHNIITWKPLREWGLGEGLASGCFLPYGFQDSSCLGVNKYPSIQYTCGAFVPMDLSYPNALKEQDTFVHFPSKIPGYPDQSLSISSVYVYAWDLRNRHTVLWGVLVNLV